MAQTNIVATKGNNNKPDDRNKFPFQPIWPQAHTLGHKAGSTSPRLIWNQQPGAIYKRWGDFLEKMFKHAFGKRMFVQSVVPALWFIHFPFPLISLKVSKDKVHFFFIW